MGIHPGVSHHAGAQVGWKGAVELVPHLPPRVGVRRHPPAHAGRQDGRPLQAGLRPAQRLAGPARACVVPDSHSAAAGILPDAVRQAGEAGRPQAHLRLRAPVERSAGSAGGAGPQYIPREEGGLGGGIHTMVQDAHLADGSVTAAYRSREPITRPFPELHRDRLKCTRLRIAAM